MLTLAAALFALGLQESPTDLVKAFLDGKPGAEEKLRARKTDALHALAHARLAKQAAQCKALVAELQPKSLPPVPVFAHWSSQPLSAEEDKVVAEKLLKARVTIATKNATRGQILKYLCESTSINIVAPDAMGHEDDSVTLWVGDHAPAHVIELITLPYGFDAKIEGGAVVIVRRKS